MTDNNSRKQLFAYLQKKGVYEDEGKFNKDMDSEEGRRALFDTMYQGGAGMSWDEFDANLRPELDNAAKKETEQAKANAQVPAKGADIGTGMPAANAAGTGAQGQPKAAGGGKPSANAAGTVAAGNAQGQPISAGGGKPSANAAGTGAARNAQGQPISAAGNAGGNAGGNVTSRENTANGDNADRSAATAAEVAGTSGEDSLTAAENAGERLAVPYTGDRSNMTTWRDLPEGKKIIKDTHEFFMNDLVGRADEFIKYGESRADKYLEGRKDKDIYLSHRHISDPNMFGEMIDNEIATDWYKDPKKVVDNFNKILGIQKVDGAPKKGKLIKNGKEYRVVNGYVVGTPEQEALNSFVLKQLELPTNAQDDGEEGEKKVAPLSEEQQQAWMEMYNDKMDKVVSCIQDEVWDYVIGKNMPANDFEYIVKGGWKDSTLGTIRAIIKDKCKNNSQFRAAMMEDLDQSYEDWVADEAERRYLNRMGFWHRALVSGARGATSMIMDAPVFEMAGFKSAALGEKFGSWVGMKFSSKLAGNVAGRALAGGLTFGNYDLIQEGLSQIAAEEFNGWSLVGSYGKGFVTGSLLGAGNTVIDGYAEKLLDKGSKAAYYATHAGGYAAEVGFFSASEIGQATLANDCEFIGWDKTFEILGKQSAMIGLLKAKGSLEKVYNRQQMLENNKKGAGLTSDNLKDLYDAGYTDNQLRAMFAGERIDPNAVLQPKTAAEGEVKNPEKPYLKKVSEEERAEIIKKIMADNNVSWETKQKLMLSLTGVVMPDIAPSGVAVSVDEKGNSTIIVKDEDGNVISKKAVTSENVAGELFAAQNKVRVNQVKQLEGALTNAITQLPSAIEAVAKENGMSYERIMECLKAVEQGNAEKWQEKIADRVKEVSQVNAINENVAWAAEAKAEVEKEYGVEIDVAMAKKDPTAHEMEAVDSYINRLTEIADGLCDHNDWVNEKAKATTEARQIVEAFADRLRRHVDQDGNVRQGVIKGENGGKPVFLAPDNPEDPETVFFFREGENLPFCVSRDRLVSEEKINFQQAMDEMERQYVDAAVAKVENKKLGYHPDTPAIYTVGQEVSFFDGDGNTVVAQVAQVANGQVTLAVNQVGTTVYAGKLEVYSIDGLKKIQSETLKAHDRAVEMSERSGIKYTPEWALAEQRKKDEQKKKDQEVWAVKAQELANTLHIPMRIFRSIDELNEAYGEGNPYAAKCKERLQEIEKGGKMIRTGKVIPPAKGWVDDEGNVAIFLPAAASEADIKETVLHEIVGHKGIPAVLVDGWDKMNEYQQSLAREELFNGLYELLDIDVKRKITNLAIRKYKGDIPLATDEYFATTAEKGEVPSWFGRVSGYVKGKLAKKGYASLSDGDVMYLLWRSRQALSGDGKSLFGGVRDLAIRLKLEVDKMMGDKQVPAAEDKNVPEVKPQEDNNGNKEDEGNGTEVFDVVGENGQPIEGDELGKILEELQASPVEVVSVGEEPISAEKPAEEATANAGGTVAATGAPAEGDGSPAGGQPVTAAGSTPEERMAAVAVGSRFETMTKNGTRSVVEIGAIDSDGMVQVKVWTDGFEQPNISNQTMDEVKELVGMDGVRIINNAAAVPAANTAGTEAGAEMGSQPVGTANEAAAEEATANAAGTVAAGTVAATEAPAEGDGSPAGGQPVTAAGEPSAWEMIPVDEKTQKKDYTKVGVEQTYQALQEKYGEDADMLANDALEAAKAKYEKIKKEGNPDDTGAAYREVKYWQGVVNHVANKAEEARLAKVAEEASGAVDDIINDGLDPKDAAKQMMTFSEVDMAVKESISTEQDPERKAAMERYWNTISDELLKEYNKEYNAINKSKWKGKKSRFRDGSEEMDQARDEEYMQAVAKGDEETARMLIEDKMREVMPKSVIRNEDGTLKVLYHGTRSGGFTEFNIGYPYQGKGIFMTEDPEAVRDYSKTDKNIDLPKFAPDDIEGALEWLNRNYKEIFKNGYFDTQFRVDKVKDEDGDDMFRLIEVERGKDHVVDDFYTEEDVTDKIKEYLSMEDAVYPLYVNMEKPMVIDAQGSSWREIPYDGSLWTADALVKHFKDLGKHDGLIVKNVYDSWTAKGTITDYIAFNENQVKIADPVTYDDQGKPIPPSKRGNMSNPDIRFRDGSEDYPEFESVDPELKDYAKDYKEVGERFANYSGTIIKRGNSNKKNPILNFEVGKMVGSQLYVHKDYVPEQIRDIYESAKAGLPEGFEYNCVMWDHKKPDMIRFDASPDFDTAREPITGDYIWMDKDGNFIRKGTSPQIWHHKWCWVGNDYKGFDVQRAYEWSRIFAKGLGAMPSGYENKWQDQLKAAGLGKVRFRDEGDEGADLGTGDESISAEEEAARKQLEQSLRDAAKQNYGSAGTSRNQTAAAFGKIDLKAGTINLDLGGGKYDKATNDLKARGVTNLVFDPYNRDYETNRRVAEIAKKDGFDTVTCTNVLNVIDTEGARSNVILQAAKALKKGGTAYFSVYKGTGAEDARQTGEDDWQENRKLATYEAEVRQHFGNVVRNGEVITAKDPITDGKLSVWNYDSKGSGYSVFRDGEEAVEASDPFYSPAYKAVEGIKQEKGTGEQFLKMIEKNGGLKKEEDKWIGLSDFLKDKKSVTKQEVLDFIRENAVKVEEVHYSEGVKEMEELDDDEFPDFDDWADGKWDEMRGSEEFYERVNAKMEEDAEVFASEMIEQNEYKTELEKETAWDEYMNEYMEDDLYGSNWDKAETRAIEEWKESIEDEYERLRDEARVKREEYEAAKNSKGKAGNEDAANDTRLRFTLNGLDDKKEIALTVPAVESYSGNLPEIHFTDGFTKGKTVAWIRFGDKEITDKSEANARYDELTAYQDELAKKYGGNGDMEEIVDKITPEERAKHDALAAEWRKARENMPTKKVMVVDEIQSQRHQDAREPVGKDNDGNTIRRGYKDDAGIEAKKKWFDEAKSKLEELKKETDAKHDEFLGYCYSMSDKYGDDWTEKLSNEEIGKKDELYKSYSETFNDYHKLKTEISKFETRMIADSELVPDAPFRNNWHEVAMKRALRYAAENGYDEVVWTDGTTQARRYGLSAMLSHMEVRMPNIDKYFVTPYRKDGSKFTHAAKEYTYDEMVDTFGKEYADKIVDQFKGYNEKIQALIDRRAQIDDAYNRLLNDRSRTYAEKEAEILDYTKRREDIVNAIKNVIHDNKKIEINDEVGADGMQAFYDKMLPSFMNKYGKKWGVKVEPTFIKGVSDGASGYQVTDESGNYGLNMWGVKVTPEMKESVMKGQPLWRDGGEESISAEEDPNAAPKRMEGESLVDYGVRYYNWQKSLYKDGGYKRPFVYNPRSNVPKVRGGWNEKMIIKYLKDHGSHTGAATAANWISEFDSFEDFMSHVYYHGTQFGGGSMKPSILLTEEQAEKLGGGGFGERYWCVSVTTDKRTASNFTSGRYVKVMPVILCKGAKVIDRMDMTDAADLEDEIVDLWNQGVDAVRINNEDETCILNPAAICNIDFPTRIDTYGMIDAEKMELRTEEDFRKIYEFAKQFKGERRGLKPHIPASEYPSYPDFYDYEGGLHGEAYKAAMEEYKAKMEECNKAKEDIKKTDAYKEYLANDSERRNKVRWRDEGDQDPNVAPERMEGESTMDYADRVAKWEEDRRNGKIGGRRSMWDIEQEEYDLQEEYTAKEGEYDGMFLDWAEKRGIDLNALKNTTNDQSKGIYRTMFEGEVPEAAKLVEEMTDLELKLKENRDEQKKRVNEAWNKYKGEKREETQDRWLRSLGVDPKTYRKKVSYADRIKNWDPIRYRDGEITEEAVEDAKKEMEEYQKKLIDKYGDIPYGHMKMTEEEWEKYFKVFIQYNELRKALDSKTKAEAEAKAKSEYEWVDDPDKEYEDRKDQVNSDNFKAWFGDWTKDPEGSSKVVDDKGRPEVQLHATNEGNKGFDIFNTQSDEKANNNVGAHFGRSAARDIVDNNLLGGSSADDVYEVYLDIKNPYETYDWFAQDDCYPLAEALSLANEAKEKGADLGKQAQAIIDEIGEAAGGKYEWVQELIDAYNRGERFEDLVESEYLGSSDKEARNKLYTGIRKLLKLNGYDGMKYYNDLEGDGWCWVALEPEQIKSAEVSGDMRNNGEFSRKNKSIRFRDGEYEKAYKEDDEKKAGEMVREAFAQAYPMTKVVDKDGKPLMVYHGSPLSGFTKFNKGRHGIFFSDNRKSVDDYATIGENTPDAVLRNFDANDIVNGKISVEDFVGKVEEYMNNAGIISDDMSPTPKGVKLQLINNGILMTSKNRREMFFDGIPELMYYVEKQMIQNGVYPSYLNMTKPFEVDAKGESWTDLPLEINGIVLPDKYRVQTRIPSACTDEWAYYLMSEEGSKLGYDGMIVKNVYDSHTSDTSDGTITDYIVFSPDQVKSAKAFTYDNDGKMIPLSQRMQKSNPDIRFRDPSTEWADGKNEDEIKRIEIEKCNEIIEELKKRGYDDFEKRVSVTNFGTSSYIIGHGLKFRISDHQVSNLDRVYGEIFFTPNDGIDYFLGFIQRKEEEAKRVVEASQKRKEFEASLDDKWEKVKGVYSDQDFFRSDPTRRGYDEFAEGTEKGEKRRNVVQVPLNDNDGYWTGRYTYLYSLPKGLRTNGAEKPAKEFMLAIDDSGNIVNPKLGSEDMAKLTNKHYMGTNARFRWVGEEGARREDASEGNTDRMDALKLAKKLAKKERYDSRKVKYATGWEKGADGMWRHEEQGIEWNDEVLRGKLMSGDTSDLMVSDVIDDDNLLAAYPALKKVRFQNFVEEAEKNRGVMGYYHQEWEGDKIAVELDDIPEIINRINESKDKLQKQKDDLVRFENGELTEQDKWDLEQLESTPEEEIEWIKKRIALVENKIKSDEYEMEAMLKEFKKTLNHEIQHFIQHQEGWAQGGSSTTIRRFLDKQARDLGVDRYDYESLNNKYNDLIEISYGVSRAVSLFKRPRYFLKMMDHFKYSGTYDQIVEKGQELAVDAFWQAYDHVDYESMYYGWDLSKLGLDYDKMVADVKEMRSREDLDNYEQTKRLALKYGNVLAKVYKKFAEAKYEDAAWGKEMLDRLQKLEKDLQRKSDYDLYFNIAGEVEARNAGDRMDYTNEERRTSLATDTEGVKRRDQYVIDEYGRMWYGNDYGVDLGKNRRFRDGEGDDEGISPDSDEQVGNWVLGKDGKLRWKEGRGGAGIGRDEQDPNVAPAEGADLGNGEQPISADIRDRRERKKRKNRIKTIGGRAQLLLDEGASGWQDYVRIMLCGAKMRGENTEAGTRGLIDHTTGNRKDVANWCAKKGDPDALTPEELAEKIWEEMPEGMKDGCTDQDVFNEILDTVMSYKSHKTLLEDLEKAHFEEETEGISEYEKEEADKYAQSLGFHDWDDYNSSADYNAAQMERIMKDARDRYLRRLGYDGEEGYRREMVRLEKVARKAAIKRRQQEIKEELIAMVQQAESRPVVPVKRKGETVWDYAERVGEYQRAQQRYDEDHPVETMSRDQAMRAVRDLVNEQLVRDSVSQMDKRTLNSILRTLSSTNNDNLTASLEEAKRLVNRIRVRANQVDIQRLLDLKVADVNGKNMNIAKNVDDVTRRIMERLRTTVKDITESGLEDRIHDLRADNWRLREELRNMDPEADSQEILDKIEENNKKIDSLNEERRRILDKKGRDGDVNVDKAIEALQAKMDKDGEEGGEIDENDLIDMTALQIRKLILDGNTEDLNVIEMEAKLAAVKRAKRMLYDKYKDRLSAAKAAVDAEPSAENLGKWKEVSQEYVNQRDKLRNMERGLNRIVNEAQANKMDIQETLLAKLNDVVSGGKESLKSVIEQQQKNRLNVLRGAFNDIKGGVEKAKASDKDNEKNKKENWAKSVFTSALNSFEYMCQNIATNSLGKDSFMYKYFVTGDTGVIAANNTLIEGKRAAKERLDEKVKEIFADWRPERRSRKRDKLGRFVKNTLRADGQDLDAIKSFNDWWQVMDMQPERGKFGAKNEIYIDGQLATTGITVVDMSDVDAEGKLNGTRYELKDLSKGQATYIYQLWKMNDGRGKLEQMGFDEGSMEEVAEYIGEENMRMADWIQDEFLQESREKYNSRYNEIYNTSMAAIENYVPLKINDGEVQENIDLTGDSGKGAGKLVVKTGALINRTVNDKSIDINWSAAGVLWDHIEKMEEFYAFSPVRRDLSWVLSSRFFRNQVNKNSKGSFERLVKAAEIAVKAQQESNEGYMDRPMAQIQKGLIGGNIAYRTCTALKQMLSVPAFYGYSQDPEFLARLTWNIGWMYGKNMHNVALSHFSLGMTGESTFENTYKGEGNRLQRLSDEIVWCMQNVPDFYDRVMKGTFGNVRLDEAGMQGALGRSLDKYMSNGMRANQMVDAITCAIGIKTIYDYKMGKAKKGIEAEIRRLGADWTEEMKDEYRKKKMEEEHNKTIMEATVYYNSTQQSNNVAFLSPMQVSKSFVDRFNTVYQNASLGFSRQFVSSVIDLNRQIRDGKRLNEEYVRQYLEEMGYKPDGTKVQDPNVAPEESEEGGVKREELSFEEAQREARIKAHDHLKNEKKKNFVSVALYGFLLNAIWDQGNKFIAGCWLGDDQEEEKGLYDYATDLVSFVGRGTTGMNWISALLKGQVPQTGLAFSEISQFVENFNRINEESGFSPELAYLCAERLMRFGGVYPQTWTNMYLGTERFFRDSARLFDDEDPAGARDLWMDLLACINNPNSSNAIRAKQLYMDKYRKMYGGDEGLRDHLGECIDAYVSDVSRAMRYKVEDDKWENWLPSIKVLKDRTEESLRKEFIERNLTDEEREEYESFKEFKKEVKDLKDLDGAQRLFRRETDEGRREMIISKMRSLAKEDESDGGVEDEIAEMLGHKGRDKQEWEKVYIQNESDADAFEDIRLSQKVKEMGKANREVNKLYAKGKDKEAQEYERSHKEEIDRYWELYDIILDLREAKQALDPAGEAEGSVTEKMKRVREIRRRALRY